MMHTWKIVLALALVGFGSTACVTANDVKKLDLPPDQKALVKGLADPMSFIGTEKHVSITAVDGVSTFRGWGRGYPRSVEVTPGHHTISVNWRISDKGEAGPTGDSTHEIDARAGRTYFSDIVNDGSSWHVQFREITDAEMKSEVERREEIRSSVRDQ